MGNQTNTPDQFLDLINAIKEVQKVNEEMHVYLRGLNSLSDLLEAAIKAPEIQLRAKAQKSMIGLFNALKDCGINQYQFEWLGYEARERRAQFMEEFKNEMQ